MIIQSQKKWHHRSRRGNEIKQVNKKYGLSLSRELRNCSYKKGSLW